MKKNHNGILNLSDDEFGTHWVAYFDTPEKTYYYDSFGFPPDNTILNFFKRAYPNIKRNSISNKLQHQSLNSLLCGLYCCYFIIEMNTGRKFNDIIHNFGYKTKKERVFNDKKLIDYFKTKNISIIYT